MKNKLFVYILFNFFIFSFTYGQTIESLRSVSDSDFPELRWRAANIEDTTDFSIYRSGVKKDDFILVQTLHGKKLIGDSLVCWLIDTTLTEKALYKYFIALPYKKDSVIRSEIMYGHNLGAIPSPQVVRFNAEPSLDRKAINLNWELNYNFTTNTVAIFRSKNYDDGYEIIARLSGNETSYMDVVDIANEAYYYFIVIHDYFGYQRPSVRVPGIATFKEKPIPPQSFKLTNDHNMGRMTWERVGDNVIGYIVYRRINNFGTFFPLNNMFYTPEVGVSYTDSTVKDFKNKDIEYYVVSVSDGFVKSNSTDTLTLHIQGEIVKGAPRECTYVLDSLNRVMLIWTSQEADAEVKGYNVYRTGNDGVKKKINKDLIRYNVNYFVDEENTKTGECAYEIETISITNTPSMNRAGVKLNIQDIPQHLVLSLKKSSKGIQIKGLPMSQTNIKEIILYRQVNSGELKQLTKLSPNNISYTDLNVTEGELYSYSAVAVTTDNTKKTVNGGVLIRY
jgi:hypothetical protein